MRANCWHGKRDVRVDNVPDPKILNQRDAIVRITSTAICGSDLHLYNGFIPTMEKGDILGHEFMGEVVEVGREVTKPASRRPRRRAFPDRLRQLLLLQGTRCISLCENSNPNAWMAEKMWGIRRPASSAIRTCSAASPAARPSTRACRSPTSVRSRSRRHAGRQVLFLSDIFPTGYMGAEMCDIKPGDTIAVWGCGPVGQFAIASAIHARRRARHRDRSLPGAPRDGARQGGATETINYEEQDVYDALKEMTGGVGPDACIDAVGMEAHAPGMMHAYDRVKQAMMLETDRPLALRQAIMACRNGGTVSVIGVYGGFIDKFPMGSVMNRSLTMQDRPMPRASLHEAAARAHRERRHRPELRDHAPHAARRGAGGLPMFSNKQDDCIKIVLKP